MQARMIDVDAGNILKLRVAVPKQLTDIALEVSGQSEVSVHHVTLVRLDDLGINPAKVQLPAPPSVLELEESVWLVDSGAKQACVVNATAETQRCLKDYTLACLAALGLSQDCLDASRVFHVTLTNAGGGEVRASIGEPWKYPSKQV